MDGLTADLMKSLVGLGPGGILAGVWFYLWRSRGVELDAARAKIDALQEKIVGMLTMQLQAEPERRDTLAGIARSVSDQSALLKERLKV